MDIQEETSGATGMQQCNKGQIIGAATSAKREDIWQNFQEGSHVGDHEANI
jgi:hypothetical protein